MTSRFATNYQFNKQGQVNYLQVNRDGQPLQGQVPLTYQVYSGDGNETITYNGSNVLVLDTTLPGGDLTIDFSAMNNWCGRSMQLIIFRSLLNDCIMDFGAGEIYYPPFAGSAHTMTVLASQSPTVAEMCFINPTTAVVTDNPTISPANIIPGASNQVFVTNPAGTGTAWSDDIDLPGDLTVHGDTDLINDLQFNGSSGTTGQYLVKTGANTQGWQNLSVTPASITAGPDYSVLSSAGGAVYWLLPTDLKFITYGVTFLNQNINIAGPAPLLFDTSPFVDLAISTLGPISTITQPSNEEFLFGETTVYTVQINGYIDPASSGLPKSIVTLSLEIDGLEKETCVCSSGHSFTGQFPPRAILAGQIMRVLARQVVNTGQLNTFALSSAPSFASSIVISSVR